MQIIIAWHAITTILMNPKIIIIAVIVAAAIIASGAYVVSASQQQIVVAGDNVSVYYTGSFTNGTVFDSNVGAQPLYFTAGAGQVIKGFDQAVIGMKLNQSKQVTIPVNEAYGPVNPRLIVSVPAKAFGNQTVQVGAKVSEGTGRQTVDGVVVAVNATNVTVDFNPPLAGQTLVFTIKVVGIQNK